MEKCKICNKEFKSVTGMHVKTHDMSLKEYEAYIPGTKTIQVSTELVPDEKIEEIEKIEEVDESDSMFVEEGVLTPEQRVKNIFSIVDRKENISLKEFLNEFKIDEKELRKILTNYLQNDSLYVVDKIKSDSKMGLEEAEKLINEDNIETHSLYVAEALEHVLKTHTCIDLRGKPRKTWVLVKNK